MKKYTLIYLTDLFPPNDKGGAEIIAYEEATEMARLGFSVKVVTVSPKRSFSIRKRRFRSIDIYEIPTIGLFLPQKPRFVVNIIKILISLFDPLAYLVLKYIIRKEKPDIVHAHNIPTLSFGITNAISTDSKLIQTHHSYFYECPKGGLLRKWTTKGKPVVCNRKPIICRMWVFLYKHISRRPDAIMAISKYIEKKLKQYNWDKVYYCPNGIRRIGRTDCLEKKRITLEDKKQTVLFVGRLTKPKGVHLLIEAFAGLGEWHDVAELVIVGDGEEEDNLRRQAQKYNCDVKFYGRVNHDEVIHIYKSAYVVVVPSLWYEVLNTVAIEAALLGKPVIASNMPGFSDIIIDGVTGLLFEPGEVGDLRQKIKTILANPKLATQLGKEASRFAIKFDIQRHISVLMNIYDEVIKEAG